MIIRAKVLVLLMFSVLLVGKAFATTDYTTSICNFQAFSTQYNQPLATPLVATSNGFLISIGVNVPYNTALQVALYSNYSNSPNALLAQSGTVTTTSGGWVSVPINGISIIAGTTYWLAVERNTSGQLCAQYPTATGNYMCVGSPQLFGLFPNPYGACISFAQVAVDMYLNYTTLIPTKTTVSCSPSQVKVRKTTQCTATVSALIGSAPPTGTVDFASNSTGIFSPSESCTLSAIDSTTSTCFVYYSPASIGSQSMSSSYPGEFSFDASSGSTVINITKSAKK